MRNASQTFFHVKLVAKVALAAGVTAVLCLLVSLAFLTGTNGDSYPVIIRNNSITREEIGSLMLFSGLALVSLIGVLTWLIALYSSFRIAGPLYRFTGNFKTVIANDMNGLIGLRTGDSLRKQESNIMHALTAARAHYAAIDRASQQAAAALECGDADAYAKAISHLKALDAKIRI
ncbi:MAG TPA: hypothetical protein DHV59_08855 [Oxalobacteraceae bacterium]|nr:hypothetical protein [Oxalobacteraceae bacterium]